MKFNELSEEAKDKVRAANHPDTEYEWWDCLEEDYKADGEERGFDIENMYWSGFSSQGDGACWKGRVNTLTFLRYHLKPEHPQFAQYQVLLELIEQGWVDRSVRVTQSGHYSHQYTMETDTPDLVGYGTDDVLESGVLMGASVEVLCESTNINTLLDEFQLWMRDEARNYAGEYYKALEKAYDWLCSDEAIIDRDADYDEEGEIDDEPSDAHLQMPLSSTSLEVA